MKKGILLLIVILLVLALPILVYADYGSNTTANLITNQTVNINVTPDITIIANISDTTEIRINTNITIADENVRIGKKIDGNGIEVNLSIIRTITRSCDREDNKVECQRNMYKEIKIERTKDNETRIRSKNVSVVINGEIETDEDNKTYFKLNNISREVKIMPDTASERAIERLGIKVCNESNNCTIQLKEVGQGNKARLKYVVMALKERKFLFWNWKKLVKTEVDAETGEAS